MDEPTQPAPARSLSVTEPITLAIDRVGRILFKPFDPAVWFVLGFCAWLAQLGEGGGGGGTNYNYGTDRDAMGAAYSGATDWIRDNIGLAVAIVVVALSIILVLAVLFLWLSSRGKLMFVDGVIHERAAVVEPWQRFRKQGNALMLFRLAISLVALLVFGVLAGLLWGTLAATGGADGDFGAAGLMIFVPWFIVFLGVALTFALITVFTNDFVVPMMWLHGCGPVEGWRRVLPLLSEHVGSMVLYVVFKVLLGILLIVLSLIGCCMSLCLVLVPYLGTVILLPIHVFRRSYSLEFLGQLGGPYSRLVNPVDSERLPEPESS